MKQHKKQLKMVRQCRRACSRFIRSKSTAFVVIWNSTVTLCRAIYHGKSFVMRLSQIVIVLGLMLGGTCAAAHIYHMAQNHPVLPEPTATKQKPHKPVQELAPLPVQTPPQPSTGTTIEQTPQPAAAPIISSSPPQPAQPTIVQQTEPPAAAIDPPSSSPTPSNPLDLTPVLQATTCNILLLLKLPCS